MNIQAAYDQWSQTYDADKNITRDLDASVSRTALAEMRCRKILEFGCGTGKNTGLFARIGDEVLAVDFSERMIGIAEASVRARHVTFKTADITRAWPVADHSQDLISCNLILQHVADLDFVFAEASRSLAAGGHLFVSELHPIKKYQGSMARFEQDGRSVGIPAFDHQISHFLTAAARHRLQLAALNEWWHQDDAGKPPRLVTFLFHK